MRGGGGVCYLLYLNKEVALYYLIAWVLVRAWVWWHDKASWRAELACNAALLGSFLVCFLLATALLALAGALIIQLRERLQADPAPAGGGDRPAPPDGGEAGPAAGAGNGS